jgi:hypothetical protein
MGRTYWYECGRCGYRARVSGKADRGVTFSVQTILCLDCKRLYDAVTRLRVADESALSSWRNASGLRRLGLAPPDRRNNGAPPTFDKVLNLFPPQSTRRFRWLQFKPQCPVSAFHKVEAWNEPNQCPVCGVQLERSALPYRVWD